LKQVLIRVNLPDCGSYIERCRLARSSGNSCADGCDEPLRQKSGFCGGRTRAVYQTRPRSSSIGLCVLVWLSQIGFAPQYGDGAIGSSLDDRVSGSRTGCSLSVATCDRGSSTGSMSVLSSIAP